MLADLAIGGRIVKKVAGGPRSKAIREISVQGVLQCIHSDFRIGGLRPGERKSIRGKVYIVGNNINALLKRYRKDFPEHDTDEPAGAGDA